VIAILDTLVVLGFPALAVWATRTGGSRRLWTAVGGVMAGLAILGLALASAKFGNRLSDHQGYAKTAVLILVMVAIDLGIPILAGALSVSRAQGGIRSNVLVYLIGVGATLLTLLVVTGLVIRLLPLLV
jgi:hypothetical protein